MIKCNNRLQRMTTVKRKIPVCGDIMREKAVIFFVDVAPRAALLDILVAPQLGRLSDAIGRKPLLLALPCVALACRGAAAARPTILVLIAVKSLSATISSGPPFDLLSEHDL